MLCDKYEQSGLNSIKILKSRQITGIEDQLILEQKVNPKVVDRVFSLFKRLIESITQNTQKIEMHYFSVISEKDLIIGELRDQITRLELEIKRIHDHRKKSRKKC